VQYNTGTTGLEIDVASTSGLDHDSEHLDSELYCNTSMYDWQNMDNPGTFDTYTVKYTHLDYYYVWLLTDHKRVVCYRSRMMVVSWNDGMRLTDGHIINKSHTHYVFKTWLE